MGYDTDKFVGQVDEEFICPICASVMENGVQLKHCEHTFCDACIRNWLTVNSICPVDRRELNHQKDLKPISRSFRNLLMKLEIKCDFESSGCRAIIKLENLQCHVNQCEFNPCVEFVCDRDCNLQMTKSEYNSHSCVRKLAQYVRDQQSEITKLKDEFRKLMQKQKWQNGKRVTVSDNNVITYPHLEISRHSLIPIDISQSLCPLTEIYSHFEVNIINVGSNGVIGIGLVCKNYPREKFPGWDKGSIAYHGDDGKIFVEQDHGTEFGPHWENGDIIGCGIRFPKNFVSNARESVSVYFTRNDVLIGERSVTIPEGGFYPTIGFKSMGAKVAVI